MYTFSLLTYQDPSRSNWLIMKGHLGVNLGQKGHCKQVLVPTQLILVVAGQKGHRC